MTARSRLLNGANPPQPPPNHQQTPSSRDSPPGGVQTLDSDFVVILAALLCALICVLGLVAVARCAWIRRLSGRASGAGSSSSAAGTPRGAANKGVKKKVLKSLPKQKYGEDEEQAQKFSECAICLAEFAAGEEIRILPHCGHGFHVACIDTWLGSHSSCPSCRQILVVARCHKCGGLPASSPSPTPGAGPQPEPRENHVDTFLP